MFKTKSFFASALLLLTASSVAQASTQDQSAASTIIPVLVKTDSTRQITEVLPAVRLTSRAQKLLRANLEQRLNSSPEITSDYLPNSQFIADMRSVVTESSNGDKSLHFEVASTRPAPSGNVKWIQNGTNYTLATYRGSSQELVMQPALVPRERSN
ncbi:hypothetical protein [Stenotrophomonas pigmentata]|uniref:hypothetical protein n=1 Tax=Stenotrophomonas pigmentata TaxID=3055080 RepID=UPI0026F1D7F9|nr:hypothetical protein [Stenotrophomonas sp. 610A2]